MLRLITRNLRMDGHEVCHARDGIELMEWIDLMNEQDALVSLIDLVVTDLRMPGFSGQQCLERLQRHGDTTPVILITAFGDDVVRQEAYACGARAVFDKPLNFMSLRAAVLRVLE